MYTMEYLVYKLRPGVEDQELYDKLERQRVKENKDGMEKLNKAAEFHLVQE